MVCKIIIQYFFAYTFFSTGRLDFKRIDLNYTFVALELL